MILSVSLNSTSDTVIPINSFKKNCVLRTPFVYSYPGGKGINTARALSALGAISYVSGFCGDKDMQEMNRFCSSHGVQSAFLKAKGENRKCYIINEHEQSAETVINTESRYKITAKNKTGFLALCTTLAKRSDITVLSGSLPLSIPVTFYRTLINKLGSKVLLDTSGPALLYALESFPDIIKINIQEARSSFKKTLKNKADIKTFMNKMAKKYSVKTLIITAGKSGAYLLSAGKFHHVKAPKVKGIISSVGCGDTFNAGFAFYKSKNKSDYDCVRYGIACASANLLHYGACFIEKKIVNKFLKEIK